MPGTRSGDRSVNILVGNIKNRASNDNGVQGFLTRCEVVREEVTSKLAWTGLSQGISTFPGSGEKTAPILTPGPIHNTES